eukprot:gene472-598_t
MSAERGIKDGIAGFISGAACLFTGHPFDTIRVRVQTSTEPVGIIDCFTKTIRNEGFTALYKGVTSPLFGMMLENSILFIGYGQMKQLLQSDPNIPLTIPQYSICGAGAGFLASFVLTPVELIKCRLQIQTTGEKKYNGSFDCMVKILKENGVKGLYKGYVPTLSREVVGNMTFFSVYESMKKYFRSRNPNGELTLPALITSGGVGGMAYWTVLYPVDVAKSRIQVTEGNARAPSILSVLRLIYKQEGVKGLFRGYTPTIIRAFPSNAALFSVYEFMIKLMG